MKKNLIERSKLYKNYILSKFESNIVNVVIILAVFFFFQVLATIPYFNLFINTYFVISMLFLLTIYLFRFDIKKLVYVSLGLLMLDFIVTLMGGDSTFSERIGDLLY